MIQQESNTQKAFRPRKLARKGGVMWQNLRRAKREGNYATFFDRRKSNEKISLEDFRTVFED